MAMNKAADDFLNLTTNGIILFHPSSLAVAGVRKKPRRAKKHNSNLCNAAVCLLWQAITHQLQVTSDLSQRGHCRTERNFNNSK